MWNPAEPSQETTVFAARRGGAMLPDPLVVLVPALMLGSYYLAFLEDWLARRVMVGADLPTTLLDSIQKADIPKIRLVNVPYLSTVAFATIWLVALTQAGDSITRALFLGPFGFLAGLNGTLIARRICGIAHLWITGGRQTSAGASACQSPTDGYLPSRYVVATRSDYAKLATAALLGIAGVRLGPWFVFGAVAGLLFERLVQLRVLAVARHIREDAAEPGSDGSSQGNCGPA